MFIVKYVILRQANGCNLQIKDTEKALDTSMSDSQIQNYFSLNNNLNLLEKLGFFFLILHASKKPLQHIFQSTKIQNDFRKRKLISAIKIVVLRQTIRMAVLQKNNTRSMHKKHKP